MRMSKISLTDEAGGRGGVDAISAIYSRVRDDATAHRKATYAWAELTALAGQDFTVRLELGTLLPTSSPCRSCHDGLAVAMCAVDVPPAAPKREAACWLAASGSAGQTVPTKSIHGTLVPSGGARPAPGNFSVPKLWAYRPRRQPPY
jgi:hypothetical protein